MNRSKAIVCTAAIAFAAVAVAQVQAGAIFRDYFDSYANDAALTAVWPNYAGTVAGTLATDQFVTSPKSLYHAPAPGNNRYHVFADATSALVPTDADPIVWKFQFYDAAGAGNTRKTGSLHTSPGWSAVNDKWMEFGCYGSTSSTQYCIRTVNMSGPNWVVYPGSARSVGWHTMRVEVGATFIKFKIDSLAPYQVAVNLAGVKFTTVACGGPSNLYSAAGAAYYDDVHVSYLSEENVCSNCSDVPAVSIDQILKSGMTTVNVSNVNAAATQVKVYKSTGGGAFTVIGSSTATPFASTVPVTVTALVAGDLVVATQTMVVTPAGCPSVSLEGCIPLTGRTVDGCAQVPAVNVVGMIDAGRNVVRVGGVASNATAVKVYAYNSGTDTTTLIGTNNAPAGASTVIVAVAPVLVEGQVIRATQVVEGIEGCVPTSGGRRVTAPGIIEDFEGSILIRDHPAPGVSGGWYDASFQAYSILEMSTMFGSNCINIRDHGWTNGGYAIYEDVIPADGTYHILIDMLIDEPEGFDYDFYNQFQAGVIVNGTHRDASGGIVPNITAPIGKYPCLTPQRDGVGATEPIKVYVATFEAMAGDDLLLAFSTSVDGYVRSKSSLPVDPSGTKHYIGMKVDNIRLVAGPKPPLCSDVPVADILPTITTPLEAGATVVTVRNIDPAATQLRVLADGNQIGSVAPAGASQVDVTVTPLVAGWTITASQTVAGIESCQCPGAVGPMVGEGRNANLKLALGIRETGAAGGITGNIEWVGAASKGSSGEPIGRTLETSPNWQTVTFAWPSAGGTDPVTGYTGNGVVDGTQGVLESLNFTIDSANTGRYVIYIDSITNGATTIANFDSDTAGTLNVFRAPRHSGATDVNLLAYPNIAEVDATKAADGTQSYRVEFQFVDNAAKRWLRLTTVDDANTPDMPIQNPLIDLTQPITVKLLLFGAPPCGEVFADTDGDGDVDMTDFAKFQRCQTIGAAGVSPECACFDRPFDGVIGADDLTSFHNCASGAGVPANPACDD